MLYLENPTNTFTPWRGEVINDKRLPLNVEQLWTSNALAAEGLFIPADAVPVAGGTVIISTEVKRVSGVVKFVNTVGPVPSSININSAPSDLFGGPTLEAIFNGN